MELQRGTRAPCDDESLYTCGAPLAPKIRRGGDTHPHLGQDIAVFFPDGIKRSVEWRATLRKSHGEESNWERPGHGWYDLEVRSANEAAWAAAWVAAAWAAQ